MTGCYLIESDCFHDLSLHPFPIAHDSHDNNALIVTAPRRRDNWAEITFMWTRCAVTALSNKWVKTAAAGSACSINRGYCEEEFRLPRAWGSEREEHTQAGSRTAITAQHWLQSQAPASDLERKNKMHLWFSWNCSGLESNKLQQLWLQFCELNCTSLMIKIDIIQVLKVS